MNSSIRQYNVLIIGRSGAGKSAVTKLLTNNPAIKVANSLHEVTMEVNCYEGTSFTVGESQVRFRILDIPGLDRLDKRIAIREQILSQLQRLQMSLHAILYVSSLTERDTLDQTRLFGFLQQLPWSSEQKRTSVIPLLTKYDNLVMDSHDQDIKSTKKEYQAVFEKTGFSGAWSRRIYWVNHTKSLEFKIRSYEQIRDKYEGQIDRLIVMLNRIKNPLTAHSIKELIAQEDVFLLRNLFQRLEEGDIAFKKERKHHSMIIRAQVDPLSVEDGFTAVSASSIGLFISKVCQKELPMGLSALLMGVPIAFALLKLVTQSAVLNQKETGQGNSGEKMLRSYEHVCQQINDEMEREWKDLNDSLEFKIESKVLQCRLPQKKYKFFDLDTMELTYQGHQFDSEVEDNQRLFACKIPPFKDQVQWTAEIDVSYDLRRYEEQDLLQNIETLRRKFCATI